MHTYAAQLGHAPTLSLAELRAVFSDINDVRVPQDGFVIFSTAAAITQETLNALGGTMVIARAITRSSLALTDIPAILSKELEGVQGKRTFSLRCHGIPRPQIHGLYRACKQRLKELGIPSRYIGSERDPALPLQLHQDGLLSGAHGCELMILRDQKDVWVGRTIAAHDTRAYTLRDMEKPVRDMTTGILPPKLAQMLLNFGAFLVREQRKESPASFTVFDPFCGSGVIPLEAMLRGWHVLASDIAPKAITGCEKNVEWARKQFKIAKSAVSVTVWKHDARKPFELKQKPDVIVSETSLGPNLRARPTVAQAESMRKEAEKLLGAFLKNVQATLPGVPLVLTLPMWYAKKRPVTLSTLPSICKDLGFTLTLPPDVPNGDERPSLIYRRKDQFVGREIVLLAPRA